jgi:pyridoxal biosynthesis lyase PdxS
MDKVADPVPGRRGPHVVKRAVMAKKAQILEAIGVDYVDESEVLTPADEAHHHQQAQLPRPLRLRLPRPRRGPAPPAMIRTKVEAVRHVMGALRDMGPPYDLVMHTKQPGRLPVVQLYSQPCFFLFRSHICAVLYSMDTISCTLMSLSMFKPPL